MSLMIGSLAGPTIPIQTRNLSRCTFILMNASLLRSSPTMNVPIL